MTPQKYISTVLKIKAKMAEYDYLNTSIKEVQGYNFYVHLKPIDDYLLDAVIECLDDVFLVMTGIGDLASYYIYENRELYFIKTPEAEYKWSSGEEFNKEVFKMIKDQK